MGNEMTTMGDTPGKGEKRLEPVDVDVIDNLLNAQAAYFEALDGAAKHFGLDPNSEAIESALPKMLRAMAELSGLILGHISALRV